MGFFDTAQDMFDKGVAAADKAAASARSAVSGLAVEQQPFAKDFVRMCSDAFGMGWHEANGGNLSYLLTEEEVNACRPYFYTTPSSWVPLQSEAKALAGSCVMVTGSGKHLRNMAEDVRANAGLVEIDAWGMAWRIVWGLADSMPTSELSLHLESLCACKEQGKDAKVVYHAHPANLMSLSSLLPVDDKQVTLALWRGLAEGIIACPQGVAVLPWMVPGTPELAAACVKGLETADAVLAVNHGIFTCCASFDQAFGLVHTLDKSAGVYLTARAANGGNDQFANQIPCQGLRDIAQRYGLDVREEFLA